MDKALETRLRAAIQAYEESNEYLKFVELTILDAKRLLYRMKQENSKIPELVYVKKGRRR